MNTKHEGPGLGDSELYREDYELVRLAEDCLADRQCQPEQSRRLFQNILKAYRILLNETVKIHHIADKQYRQLVETQEALIELNHKLEVMSVHDNLTGLFNRQKLSEMMGNEINRLDRFGGTACLIMADIDFFKQVNDNHGHIAGDQVLVRFAQLLLAHLRKTDCCFRWGGEEFLILLPATDLAAAKGIAEKLRAAVQACTDFPHGPLSASFGVAEYQMGDDQDAWLEKADIAMFQAKQAGRNRVEG